MGQVLLHVSVEYEALTDYLLAGSDVGRQPLASALGSAAPDLDWPTAHAGPDEAKKIAAVRDTYDTYTGTLRQVVAAGSRGDLALARLGGDQAALVASSLRKQVVTNSVRKHDELNVYLVQVRHDNRRLRLAAAAASSVDLLLVLLCGLVLLKYQRRIERQAVESRRRALHDSLTGIPNRVLLADRMEQALPRGWSQPATWRARCGKCWPTTARPCSMCGPPATSCRCRPS